MAVLVVAQLAASRTRAVELPDSSVQATPKACKLTITCIAAGFTKSVFGTTGRADDLKLRSWIE